MRILVISSDVPAAPSMPGSPRLVSLVRYIARRHELHLATFASSIERYESFLASEDSSKVFQTSTLLPNVQRPSFWGRQVHRLVQAPSFVTRHRFPDDFQNIRRRIGELVQEINPDLLFVDRLEAGQYVLDFKGRPRLVDAHDAVSLNFRRAATHAGFRLKKLGLLLEGLSIRRLELATIRAVDAYVVNSPIDQEALQSYDADIKVWCIPNGVDTDYFSPNGQVSDERTMVFSGVMSYAPNRDAAHFLCGEILPRVRRVIPDVRVLLVGAEPPQDVRALADNDIIVTGTVPDVRPFVQRAAVYVSPLRFGTGIKNKVLAALAMGKAVVATPESCAGLEVKPGKDLLVGGDPDDLAAHIVELLSNPRRRCQLGVAGRSLVVERYGWDAMGQRLEMVLHSLVVPPAPQEPHDLTDSAEA